MLLMPIPVIYIQFCQVLRLDDQQILSVLLLSSLGEVKWTGYYCFLIDDHDLIMRDGMFAVNVGWNASIRYKSGGGISFSFLALVKNSFYLYSSFEGISESLGNCAEVRNRPEQGFLILQLLSDWRWLQCSRLWDWSRLGQGCCWGWGLWHIRSERELEERRTGLLLLKYIFSYIHVLCETATSCTISVTISGMEASDVPYCLVQFLGRGSLWFYSLFFNFFPHYLFPQGHMF